MTGQAGHLYLCVIMWQSGRLYLEMSHFCRQQYFLIIVPSLHCGSTCCTQHYALDYRINMEQSCIKLVWYTYWLFWYVLVGFWHVFRKFSRIVQICCLMTQSVCLPIIILHLFDLKYWSNTMKSRVLSYFQFNVHCSCCPCWVNLDCCTMDHITNLQCVYLVFYDKSEKN